MRADRAPDESAAQEILGLRKKIDELEARIVETEFAAPPGTEGLAHGKETISLHFRYQLYGRDAEDAAKFTWDEILSILGPVLIIQASESDLKEKLAESFQNRINEKSGNRAHSAYMRDDEFQQVKLQLRALGLISEIKDRSFNGGDLAVWTLTPYGDRVMTQVAAIRSSAKV